jgi:calcineurin-like phosphoesterase family protein
VILTTDLHLTDLPADEYRWQIFPALHAAIKKYNDKDIAILGDVTDRKDKHSSALVNRLVDELRKLAEGGARIGILMGNHDRPLHGPPYWSFINFLPYIRFYTKPRVVGHKLMFPWSANPSKDLTEDLLKRTLIMFMHQTINGAQTVGGRKLEVPPIKLPKDIPIYSGDIHVPQKIGNVVYVGAPHPIDFGDDYPCRMLVLDGDYNIQNEIKLDPPRKIIANVRSEAELQTLKTRQGDQVRIRFSMPAGRAESWPAEEEAIRTWATERGILLASTEAILETGAKREAEPDYLADPADVLRAYAEAEGLDEDVLEVGKGLMEGFKEQQP